MKGDKCHKHAKLVPSARKKPMHNARKASKTRTIGERLLKLQRKNYTRLSNDENKDEGLYNKIKAWKLVLFS